MLRFLSIRNLALIDRLELELEPGLNVLTGETGAGKSILVGALSLLTGSRASTDLIRTGASSAVVEAIFEDAAGEEHILRRDISAQTGRSRAAVNGQLINSASLRDAAAGLVDLHGQHDHQLLLDPRTHLDLLDAFAGLDDDRTEVAAAFACWRDLGLEAARLATSERERTIRCEIIDFQLGEIRRVAPTAGEDESLAAERQVLANADRLHRLCTEAYSLLYEGDGAALGTLASVWRKVADLAAIDAQFLPHLAARDGVKSQLEDLAYFLRSYEDRIDAPAGRLQQLEDRLAMLERLKKKYGPTLTDVLSLSTTLERELDSIRDAGSRSSAIAADLDRARTHFLNLAEQLSIKRHTAGVDLSRRLECSLADLAMTGTRCEARVHTDRDQPAWSERGIDEAELYISPNPGEDLRPLARIASGGELSRLMLALKTLASTDAPGKALVFDEVDAGIGGAVADIVGARLRALAGQFQVLCITHLPQIAAYGTTHFQVTKRTVGDRTTTDVSRLSDRAREHELARMIAGTEVSAAVRASAREMLQKRA